jgi:hypothetical protein
MAGHVSKASDVYAYGILLYEIISGMRAYAGVPIPLLPHEVAMQGLRPEWPKNMPAEVCRLRDLAEACWQHKPQDRCVSWGVGQVSKSGFKLCGSEMCCPGWLGCRSMWATICSLLTSTQAAGSSSRPALAAGGDALDVFAPC